MEREPKSLNNLEEILEKARQLDKNALTTLTKEYYPTIFRYFYYRTKTKEDAEDLASEVFVKLVKGIRYQSGNFDAWIYRIARNLLVDYYRRKTIRKEFHINDKIIETIAYQDKASSNVLTEEELKQAMQGLTEEQKEIITLKFIEGYDNEKISQITGKSIGAIKALQFRALVTLKDFFKKD